MRTAHLGKDKKKNGRGKKRSIMPREGDKLFQREPALQKPVKMGNRQQKGKKTQHHPWTAQD